MSKTIVLSLGGSVIIPNMIDVNFLKNFKKITEKFIKKNYKFVIFCGGGKLARDYQKAASLITKLNNSDLDWIGIKVTWINAFLVKTIFKNIAENFIVTDPTKKIKFTKKGQPYIITRSGKARFIKRKSARLRKIRKGGFS